MVSSRFSYSLLDIPVRVEKLYCLTFTTRPQETRPERLFSPLRPVSRHRPSYLKNVCEKSNDTRHTPLRHYTLADPTIRTEDTDPF